MGNNECINKSDKQAAKFNGYSDGGRMWHENASIYGIDEAITICRNYLELNLKRAIPSDEADFCHSLFYEMYRDTADKAEPKKLIYAYSLEEAERRTESSYYYKSYNLNNECADGIDRLIKDSCYKPNYYNLRLAAMMAIMNYGFNRICSVLAFNYQNKKSDGRLTSANREWLDKFIIEDAAFRNTWLQSHSILIDGFCGYVRDMYKDLSVQYFVLPGNEVFETVVNGYKVAHRITTSNDGNGFITGFAIGHNTEAVRPWVCWQFAVRDNQTSYNLGIYGEEREAIDAYNSRVFVALNDV